MSTEIATFIYAATWGVVFTIVVRRSLASAAPVGGEVTVPCDATAAIEGLRRRLKRAPRDLTGPAAQVMAQSDCGGDEPSTRRYRIVEEAADRLRVEKIGDPYWNQPLARLFSEADFRFESVDDAHTLVRYELSFDATVAKAGRGRRWELLAFGAGLLMFGANFLWQVSTLTERPITPFWLLVSSLPMLVIVPTAHHYAGSERILRRGRDESRAYVEALLRGLKTPPTQQHAHDPVEAAIA